MSVVMDGSILLMHCIYTECSAELLLLQFKEILVYIQPFSFTFILILNHPLILYNRFYSGLKAKKKCILKKKNGEENRFCNVPASAKTRLFA